MVESTFETMEKLLDGALEEVDNPEVRYKLRSVQQLLRAVQQRHEDLDEALDETVGDEDILTNLRDLGYLE
jgi:hypothetical protein